MFVLIRFRFGWLLDNYPKQFQIILSGNSYSPDECPSLRIHHPPQLQTFGQECGTGRAGPGMDSTDSMTRKICLSLKSPSESILNILNLEFNAFPANNIRFSVPFQVYGLHRQTASATSGRSKGTLCATLMPELSIHFHKTLFLLPSVPPCGDAVPLSAICLPHLSQERCRP